MLLVNLLLCGGEDGDAGGGGGLDNGVEVEGDGDGGFLAEVGKVEDGLAYLTLPLATMLHLGKTIEIALHSTFAFPHAGDELADFHLWGDGVDIDDIVGAGFGDIEAGTEGEFDMQAVGMVTGNLHFRQRSAGKEQGWVVDADGAVFVHEMVFIEARKIVGLGHAVFVCFLGEATLQDGAEKGGRGLSHLEESPLAQLSFRLAVVILRWKLARIGAAEAGVVYLTTDGAGVFDEGWFYLCHSVTVAVYNHQRRNRLFIVLLPWRDIVFG